MSLTEQNPQEPEILVIGNSLPETLIQGRRARRQLGGVGAIMAEELRFQGEDPLFLTPVSQNAAQDQNLTQLLQDSGLRYQTIPTRQPAAWSQFDLNPGGRPKGQWPTYGWHDIKAAVLKVLEGGWPHSNRWLLLDCSFSTEALGQILRLAQTNRWQVIANGTTKYRCKRLGGSALEDCRIHALTLNREEMAVLTQMCGARPNAPHTVRKMFGGAQYLLNTRDREGWTLYTAPNQELSRPAGPKPPGGHTLGAGDAATAGLARALLRGLDPAETIQKGIRDRLHYNAESLAAAA